MTTYDLVFLALYAAFFAFLIRIMIKSERNPS